MSRLPDKRTVDMRVLGEWVEPRSRVCDLGCGRGILLEHLVHTKQVQAVGVDLDLEKIAACVRRGVTAYQGDMGEFLRALPDRFFDRIVCSRTLEELPRPAEVLREALRVASVANIGFVNHAFWKNRLGALLTGRKLHNEVYTADWGSGHPTNPVSIADFEVFCQQEGYVIRRRLFLRGDWETPCRFRPNLFAGYAFYEIARP
jgi:methionine biosynthesis protein MetW